MEDAPVIYTDGHGVRVTPEKFETGTAGYFVNGITRVRMMTIKPNRDMALFLIVLGLIAAVLGMFHVISPVPILSTEDVSFSPNDIAKLVGGILLVAGIIWSATAKCKYTVRITTAEGDKDALVSEKRDYVKQIVTAVIEAENVSARSRGTI